MAELGYYEQIQGGIFGQPDGGGSDPVSRAALQEASAALERTFTTKPGYVPPNYAGPHVGGGSLPIVGWTAQNSTGPAFHPYDPNVGTTPDWNNDPNPIGAGSYDMTPLVSGGWAFDRNSVAPRGADSGGIIPNPDPNFLPQDQGGTGDLEW